MEHSHLQAAPRSFEELKFLVAEGKVRLPRQLYRIMLKAIDGPDLIAFGSTHEVAAVCSVSPTTVSRLARHLGLKSFKELKTLFREPFRQTGM